MCLVWQSISLWLMAKNRNEFGQKSPFVLISNNIAALAEPDSERKMQASELQKVLENALTDCQVIVQGDDGRHFEVTAIGEVFASLNPVKKQQYVYSGLNELIASGEVHAVQIRTFTPDQWKDAEKLRVG